MTDEVTREQRIARRAALRAEPQWFLVQTNPQNERKAVAEIRRAGMRAYLPKRAVYRKRRDDKLPIKRWPVLVGYVMVKFVGAPDFFRLRQCQGVKGVLYIDGKPHSIPQSEVAGIMRAQRAMRFDAPNARAIRKGWAMGMRDARRVLAAERFAPGVKVWNAGAMIMARVVEVTKRGTVKAIIEDKDRVVPVEFSDPDALAIVEEGRAAA